MDLVCIRLFKFRCWIGRELLTVEAQFFAELELGELACVEVREESIDFSVDPSVEATERLLVWYGFSWQVRQFWAALLCVLGAHQI